MLAAQPRELCAAFGPKKPPNAGLRSVSDMCVSAASRLVRGLNNSIDLDPPHVHLLGALWSLLDGIWGVLKGSWGVLGHKNLRSRCLGQCF